MFRIQFPTKNSVGAYVYLFGSECRTRTPIARPVMVDFSRPDVSESGSCRSRWWTSLPDSGSSPVANPSSYERGVFIMHAQFFSLHALRLYTLSVQCVWNFNLIAASHNFSIVPRVNYTCEKKRTLKEVCVICTKVIILRMRPICTCAVFLVRRNFFLFLFLYIDSRISHDLIHDMELI